MKHAWTITILLSVLFFISQVLGLVVLNSYVDFDKSTEDNKIYKKLPYNIERPQVEGSVSFLYIITAVIIGTLILLLIIKFRKPILWKLWYFFAVWLSLGIAFAAFISQGIANILAVLIAFSKTFKPNVVVNLVAELFIYAGIAAIFVPIMNMTSAFILLIAISLYDIHAVWYSKHMVKMAEFQKDAKLFAGIAVPYISGKRKGKKKSMKKAKNAKVAILGGGDIAFPLLFTGTAMKTFGFSAIIISFTATIALLYLFYIAKKDKFYPAMPFISAGCFIGYALLFLF